MFGGPPHQGHPRRPRTDRDRHPVERARGRAARVENDADAISRGWRPHHVACVAQPRARRSARVTPSRHPGSRPLSLSPNSLPSVLVRTGVTCSTPPPPEAHGVGGVGGWVRAIMATAGALAHRRRARNRLLLRRTFRLNPPHTHTHTHTHTHHRHYHNHNHKHRMYSSACHVAHVLGPTLRGVIGLDSQVLPAAVLEPAPPRPHLLRWGRRGARLGVHDAVP